MTRNANTGTLHIRMYPNDQGDPNQPRSPISQKRDKFWLPHNSYMHYLCHDQGSRNNHDSINMKHTPLYY